MHLTPRPPWPESMWIVICMHPNSMGANIKLILCIHCRKKQSKPDQMGQGAILTNTNTLSWRFFFPDNPIKMKPSEADLWSITLSYKLNRLVGGVTTLQNVSSGSVLLDQPTLLLPSPGFKSRPVSPIFPVKLSSEKKSMMPTESLIICPLGLLVHCILQQAYSILSWWWIIKVRQRIAESLGVAEFLSAALVSSNTVRNKPLHNKCC